MAPPTALAIATQAVQRLVKEESYYHKEKANQEARIKKLEEDIAAGNTNLDSNADFMLKQEVRSTPSTQAISCHFRRMWNSNPGSRKPLWRRPRRCLVH